MVEKWTLVGYESEDGDFLPESHGLSRSWSAASSSTVAAPGMPSTAPTTAAAEIPVPGSSNEFVLDAVSQARDMYETTDPDADPNEISVAVEKAALEATLAEAMRKTGSDFHNKCPDWREAHEAALDKKEQGTAL